MELNIATPQGNKGTVEVSDVAFDREFNQDLVHQAVTAFLAGARQGTRAQKSRAAVSGGGKKPWRQKGTGRARQGTIRAPHMVGGGRAHGPQPRDYSQTLPKKVKKLARRSVLAYKAKESKIVVVEDFEFDGPKTKKVIEMLNKLGVTDRKVLILTGNYDQNFYRSARNIPYKSVLTAPQFSTYDVLNANTLVLQKGAVNIINEVLG